MSLSVCVSQCVFLLRKGGTDISGPYEVVPNWPRPLHADWKMGGVAAVYAESPNRIYVAVRGELRPLYERGWAPETIEHMIALSGQMVKQKGRWEHVITVYDREGKLIESWERHIDKIKSPNRIQVNPFDPEKHIWIVDQGGAGILQFTHDGKELVMQLTEKDVPGAEKGRFGFREVAFLPNGDFYVAGISRVVKFSKEGKYLFEFGKPGKGPGEFNQLHGIVIDHATHRIYLADKNNSRIQVVDENGKYLDQWPNILYPMTIRLSKDNHL